MDEQRYRTAERRLFDAAGIEPIEDWIDLHTIGTRVRVLSVGEGPPVVFFHGGPNAAATWAQVAARLPNVRSILVDRPGTGLSAPPPTIPDRSNVSRYAVDFGVDVLDGLHLERTSIVGSSFGGYVSLRLARAIPHRISRLVLVGCPAFVPGWKGPQIATLLRTPVLGRILLSTRPTMGAVRMSLRQFGHGRAHADDVITTEMLDWILAWQRHTDTMRNDGRMIIGCGSWRGGFDPALDLTTDDLAGVTPPTTILVGTADPVGGGEVANRLAEAIPTSTAHLLPGAGHLPWLDDPTWVAGHISRVVIDAGAR